MVSQKLSPGLHSGGAFRTYDHLGQIHKYRGEDEQAPIYGAGEMYFKLSDGPSMISSLHKAVPIARSETICLRLSWTRLRRSLVWKKSQFLWSIAPTDVEAFDQLRDKIKSKMDTAKLLGSFIVFFLGLVLGILSDKTKLEFLTSSVKPNGIFLVTGPTGSGKTTALYAALQELNKPDKKIITVEDPVEYNFDGMNQCQVKEENDLTFDRILRAMLLQAPNIILISEIRDGVVADIAIQATPTGHLVFSTL